jgi:hypothetical protein
MGTLSTLVGKFPAGGRNPALGIRKDVSGAVLEVVGVVDASSGTGSITAAKTCTALIYLGGAGGSGADDTTNAAGGGGGAAVFKRMRLAKGQTLSYSVGAAGAAVNASSGHDGGDTTVTLPNGLTLTAGGGKAGPTGVVNGGAGGIATGGDINRNGGAGGSGSGGSGASGGIGGGAGGAGGSGSNRGGGGGGAGFSDVASFFNGAGGGQGGGGGGVGGGSYGGGGGSINLTSGAGAAGRVVIWLVRVT